MQKERLDKAEKIFYTDKFLKSKKVDICIFVIFYLFLIVIHLISGNIKPPSKSEYKPLYEQAIELETNFGSIVNMKNASCNFDSGSMEVTLQSKKEHFLKVTFNYDLNEIVKYEEFDNITSIYWVLIKSLFFAFVLTLLVVAGTRIIVDLN